MKIPTIYKYILFIFLAAAFFLPEIYLPLIEQKMGWQVTTLGGQTNQKERPTFNARKWQLGHYQKHYDSYVKDQSLARDLMVRFRNQLDYDFFNASGNKTIILGKEGMLYSKKYIEAVVLPNTRSKEWVEEQARKLKFIIDYFEQKNTKFLVISPPSKARVYPDELPNNFQGIQPPTTNRSLFKSAFAQQEIPFLDLDFLITYESKHQLPVYPQAGLHWNYLGAALVADSVRQFLVDNYDLAMPAFVWQDTIPIHTNFKLTDTELSRSANLLNAIDLKPMPYPEIKYTFLSDKLCPKAIVIGDSYYQILLEEGHHENLFQKGSPYWHYFGAERFTSKDKLNKFVRKEHQVLTKIAAADIVIIAFSESNLSKFSNGFVDFVYSEIQAKTESK